MKTSGCFTVKLTSRKRFRRLVGDHFKIKGLRAGLVTLRPKQAIGEHNTEKKEEALIILKGIRIPNRGNHVGTVIKSLHPDVYVAFQALIKIAFIICKTG